jgi:alginate O-acetyltransferase complex protein AlgI
VALLGAMGISYHPPHLDILLPVGISFYTFHTLSYTIDVYRRRAQAGILAARFRAVRVLLPAAGRRTDRARPRLPLPARQDPPAPVRGRFAWGVFLMTMGLFEKVVVADTLLAPTADLVFGHPFPLAALDAWAGALAFGMQILCDFSGYSLTAIGADLCFGFYLLDNFKFPYGASGFSDFWRRWHISLSSWLRDYLYIPLGGNRLGTARTCFNLMFVMLLGGLWHGAAWTFVLWGALHGLFLLIERAVRFFTAGATWTDSLLARTAGWLLTVLGVTITWVFFRAADFPTAMKTLVSMFGAFGERGDQILATRDLIEVGAVVAVVLTAHRLLRDSSIEAIVQRSPRWWVMSLRPWI